MQYIVMDLEWNNTYGRKTNSFINEIIEIGAVKLDERLEFVDEFSCIIKSQIGKKLRGDVKKLTKITNDDVKHGEPFAMVMQDFKSWVGDSANVILTWGDGDIRVLIENFKYICGIGTLPFLSRYADLQRYFHFKKGLSKDRQIGLSAAAALVGIDESDFSHHRALDDSRLTAECLRRIFDVNDFAPYTVECNDKFYGKLAYKPHAISNINNPLVDKSLLSYVCEDCGISGELKSEWKYSNQYFRAVYHCPGCNKNVRVSVRFKKYFDRLETRKTVSLIPKEAD